MEFWIVGRIEAVVDEGVVWTFVGLYSSESLAVKHCRDSSYFIGPCKPNQLIPDCETEWKGAYVPVAGRGRGADGDADSS